MAADTIKRVSPFLDSGPHTTPGTLAIVALSRDNLIPVYLQDSKGAHDGYAEGVVVNTRYGSFPHSTLLNVPWGSQIRASNVDTGSRGRKRKRPEGDAGDAAGEVNREDAAANAVKQAATASSGFVHILPPTPELWTASLPHRTQVVYTPDYSYVLHRIRARPGTRIIEAGSGSGSFTHASARAVYNGYPRDGSERKGKVFSFEYHETRFEKMKNEILGHGLDGLVQLTHRDVYKDGFLVDGESPEAESIFLDLPAPWQALPHLSRSRPQTAEFAADGEKPWVSPLNPKKSAYICTFSPCIEQVTKTVSAMRRLGWVNIEMVEIANRRLQVFRDRVGLHIPTERGANLTPANVGEAVARLAEIEERFKEHSKASRSGGNSSTPTAAMDVDTNGDVMADANGAPYKIWKEGRLITKGEPEVKTHTSYLVFAVLPREWSAEEEEAAFKRWPCGGEEKVIGSLNKQARREEKIRIHGGKNKDTKKKVEKDVEAESKEAAAEA
ncbi:tRNA methyltransferase complex GCD14 subunit [Coniochaeta hoffmannii]|uniref:tRNA (adenine(58)-N(1))-methyltransferase catalytic subunit TRM61 n=1 Tax=Coniochaeta hoffmannii TaxID=91930 RepID=A0AA38RTN8_9PEZI|nr:tRNA methyltransferase complex GCD14 subunit [Coniochaeta hoffmannii]